MLTTVKAFQVFHVLRQIAIIVINIFLAKSVLGTDVIGSYEKLMFLSFMLSFFWVSGLTQGLLSFFPKLEKLAQSQLLVQLYLFFLALSFFIFFVLHFSEYWVANYLLGQAELPYFDLFILYMFLNFPTYLVENIYLLKEEPKAIVAFGGVSFGLHALVVLLPIYLGYNFQWSFIGLIAMAAVKHTWLLFLLHRVGEWTLVFSHLQRLFALAYPLVLYALLGGFAQVFDNWLVAWYYNGDDTTFAIFRYGARELPLALAVAAAFSNAMLPRVAADLPTALQAIKQKSRILLHLLFPLAIILAMTSPYLYPLVFSEAFEASYVIFNVFLLVLISRLVFPHTILIALEENRFIFRVSVLELVLNITVSIVLLPYLGLAGIAIGTVVAYSFEKIAYILYLQRKYDIRFQQYADTQWLSLYSFFLLLSFYCCTSF